MFWTNGIIGKTSFGHAENCHRITNFGDKIWLVAVNAQGIRESRKNTFGLCQNPNEYTWSERIMLKLGDCAR